MFGIMQDAAPTGIIATTRNARYVEVKHENNCAGVEFWKSPSVTVGGVQGCCDQRARGRV
jgi:hypothetical protein